jgi:photosystem II stability/assembly factor-like uncharacterized protein
MKQKLGFIAAVLLLIVGCISNAQSQWVQTNGPYGGSVSCLAAIGTNVFAVATGDYRNGLFLSTDNGKNWKRVNTPWKEGGTGTLMVSGNNLFVVAGGGIYLSTDIGVSWKKAADSGLTTHGASPTCFAVIGTTLFAGIGSYSFSQNDGLYRSTDNGDTWIAAGKGLSNTHVHALVSNGTNLFAGTSSGICLSTDSGTSWNLVDSGLSKTYIDCLAVIGDDLFAGTPDHGILRSTDNGASWNAGKFSLTDSIASCFAVSGGNLFAGTLDGVFRTTDNGESWTAMDTVVMNDPSQSLRSVRTIAVSGSNLFAGTWTGVFLSTNIGQSWTDVTSNMIARGASVYAYRSLLYSGGGFVSTDDGASWLPDSSGLPSAYVITENGPFLISRAGNGIYFSTDKGSHWTKSADSGLLSLPWDLTSAFAMIGSNIFISSTTGGVFRSTDIGASWTSVNNGFTISQGFSVDSNSVLALATIGTNLFAATRFGGIYRSSDSGAYWTQVNTGLPQNIDLNGFSVIGTNLYAEASLGNDSIFLSTDNGSSWKAINSGVPTGISVGSFTSSGANIFAVTGSSGRVFLSTNVGTSWAAVDSGLTKNSVNSLAINGSYIFAGTTMNGVWRRPLSDFGISNVKNSTKNDLKISLSPNPTTGIITIHNAPANILRITITNLLGEIELELTHPNAQEFTLDLSKLPPGTYFVRFSLANEVITRKIMKE